MVSISCLSPDAITASNLLYVNEEIFSVSEQMDTWLNRLV